MISFIPSELKKLTHPAPASLSSTFIGCHYQQAQYTKSYNVKNLRNIILSASGLHGNAHRPKIGKLLILFFIYLIIMVNSLSSFTKERL
ncbi:hypothetical protein NTG1052_20018 [Candidatus Nitrotoga sp. 1052]|nr:hypothetical protein NTG1052_20018 [Candidatus Nitrotoga sp. 1052]